MTAKKIVFAVMCVLLVLVIIVTGIVISKISRMMQGTTVSKPTGTTSTGQNSSTPSEETTLPTESSAPTQPPTEETEPDHEHDWVLTEDVKVTCDTYGYKVYTCTVCGKQNIPQDQLVEPYGHTFGAGQVIAPTCTEYGCTRYTCTVCGKTEERNVKKATGHNFEFVESHELTCVEDGYDLYRCTNCGEEERRDLIEATGHDYHQVGEATLPTCTEDGCTSYICLICDGEMQETVPATGHSYGDWYQGDDGNLERECETCGDVQTTADLDIIDPVEKTVSEDGSCATYVIYVGTAAEPRLHRFTIYDYLNNGSMKYGLDAVRGLVITYMGEDGEQAEITLAFFTTEAAEIATG